jgi:para-nitrobenzyl esterase
MEQPGAAAVTFETPAGLLVGRRDGAVVRASSIRYARAARFAPPQPEPPATATLVADTPAPACPQVPEARLDAVLGDFMTTLRTDEDCLRLSITLPADRRLGEQLPVLVWVHGGSYVSGAGDLPLYDPAVLVAEQRVLFVAVTYRLGLLGWLGYPGGPPANLGLLDLLEALRWVQRNASALGGNPALVTLLGHSSGADAVARLLLVPEARGLFRRVILHSPPLGLARGRARMGQAMAAAVAPLPATGPVAAVLAREQLATRAARRFGLRGAMPFGPQFGAAPLPAECAAAQAWQAAAPAVEVLIGTTADETRFFAVIDPALRWLGRVPGLGQLVVAVTSWLVYKGGVRAFARRHARAGGRAYRFVVDYRPPGSAFGAAHCIDLPLLLGTPAAWAATPLLGRATWPEVLAAGQPLRQLWMDFARTGQLPVRTTLPGVARVWRVPGA